MAALLLALSCQGDRKETAATAGPAIFEERAAETGLLFRHVHGGTGEFYFPEIMGPGGALFDMDGDGDLDAYLVQGAPVARPASPEEVGRLYRNDLTGMEPRFVDVTEPSGIRATGVGMGVATGDYDNDGAVDLYLTNFGSNQLLHNDGDGTFTDATAAAGADDPRWSTSAAFFDYDRDGWLDLFVVNYVDFRATRNIECTGPSGRRDYCSPTTYEGEPARLLRNRGNGKFEDVSGRAGILAEYSSGLGVVTADYDRDGFIDVYVANDQRPNFLWMNRGDGTFENLALLSGTAVSLEGKSQAGMGVDAGDIDNDGDDDLFKTNLVGEMSTMYVNQGNAIFDDLTDTVQLGLASLPHTGFGAGLIDYDNDGWLDVLTVNGAVYAIEDLARAGDPFPYHETKQLFRNRGDGTFAEVTALAGKAFTLSEVGRGAAFGDVDNDGDVDALICNAGGPARLLINQVGQSQHWLGLRLVGHDTRRDMLGARVEVVLPGGERRFGRSHTDSSYLSANDPRVLVGLGGAGRVERVRVSWPGGATEEWTDVPSDRYTTLVEGTGGAARE